MVQYPACSSSPATATTAEQDRPLPWRDGRRIGEGGRVPRGAPGRAGALLRRRYVLPCLPPVGSSTYMTGGTVFFTLRRLEEGEANNIAVRSKSSMPPGLWRLIMMRVV